MRLTRSNIHTDTDTYNGISIGFGPITILDLIPILIPGKDSYQYCSDIHIHTNTGMSMGMGMKPISTLIPGVSGTLQRLEVLGHTTTWIRCAVTFLTI